MCVCVCVSVSVRERECVCVYVVTLKRIFLCKEVPHSPRMKIPNKCNDNSNKNVITRQLQTHRDRLQIFMKCIHLNWEDSGQFIVFSIQNECGSVIFLLFLHAGARRLTYISLHKHRAQRVGCMSMCRYYSYMRGCAVVHIWVFVWMYVCVCVLPPHPTRLPPYSFSSPPHVDSYIICIHCICIIFVYVYQHLISASVV